MRIAATSTNSAVTGKASANVKPGVHTSFVQLLGACEYSEHTDAVDGKESVKNSQERKANRGTITGRDKGSSPQPKSSSPGESSSAGALQPLAPKRDTSEKKEQGQLTIRKSSAADSVCYAETPCLVISQPIQQGEIDLRFNNAHEGLGAVGTDAQLSAVRGAADSTAAISGTEALQGPNQFEPTQRIAVDSGDRPLTVLLGNRAGDVGGTAVPKSLGDMRPFIDSEHEQTASQDQPKNSIASGGNVESVPPAAISGTSPAQDNGHLRELKGTDSASPRLADRSIRSTLRENARSIVNETSNPRSPHKGAAADLGEAVQPVPIAPVVSHQHEQLALQDARPIATAGMSIGHAEFTAVASHSVAALDLSNVSRESRTPTGHQTSPADTAIQEQAESPIAFAGINAVQVLQNMGRSEMHVGMRSAEFGEISVRTAISQQQMTTQIAVDHRDLGSAIALHASSIVNKLDSSYGLHALIDVKQSGASFSGNGSHEHHQEQKDLGHSFAPVGTSGETQGEQLKMQIAAQVGDPRRLDIRV